MYEEIKAVRIENIDRIHIDLDKANSRVKVRKLDYDLLIKLINDMKNQLSKKLNKTDWVGLKFNIDPNGQEFAKSYMGVPFSTQFQLEIRPSGWFVKIGRLPAQRRVIEALNISTKLKQLAEFQLKNKAWN